MQKHIYKSILCLVVMSYITLSVPASEHFISREVEYRTDDGWTISATLRLPVGAARNNEYPAMVLLHEKEHERLARQKNHGCTIRSLALLRDNNIVAAKPALIWLCLGLVEDNAYMKKLRRQVGDLGLDNSCRFIESVSNIPDYYGKACPMPCLNPWHASAYPLLPKRLTMMRSSRMGSMV